MSEDHGSYIKVPRRSLTPQEEEWIREIVLANPRWADAQLGKLSGACSATDSKGHASHLIITKEEKVGLISNLDDSFGAKLDQKGQNYTVSAAVILKGYLNKDFKCSDEPWD
jgi:hypothetical protein